MRMQQSRECRLPTTRRSTDLMNATIQRLLPQGIEKKSTWTTLYLDIL